MTAPAKVAQARALATDVRKDLSIIGSEGMRSRDRLCAALVSAPRERLAEQDEWPLEYMPEEQPAAGVFRLEFK